MLTTQSKPHTNLKSSARRQLLSSICKDFGLDEARLTSEAKLDLAPKELRHGRIVLHNGDKAVLFTDIDGKPLWIKLKETYLVPTIFTLWKCPYLAKIILTPGQVLEVLQGGADLMIPGCFPPYPEISPNQVVAVGLLARPTVPIGVGIALTPLGNLDRSVKGKAVQMVHVIGDTLCDKYKSELKPPLEFDTSVPYIDATTQASTEPQTVEEPNGAKSEFTSDSAPKEAASDISEVTESTKNITIDEPSSKSGISTESEFTTEEIDEAFRVGLLQTLRKALDNPLELPITASNLVANHILQNLPFDSASVQMKKTSWKKASKFFKAMEKDGLVKVRDRSDDVVVQEVAGKEDDRVKNFQIFKVKKKTQDSGNSKSTSDQAKLTSIDLWKPHAAAQRFFAEAAPNSVAQYYDNDTLKSILVSYINDKKLVDKGNKKNIQADDLLAGALNMPKEGALNPALRSIGRDKLVSKLQNNCTAYHVIYDTADPALQDETSAALLKTFKPVKGQVPTILIETERRGGNKVVTKVTNMEPFHISPTGLAEELRRTCAGSTAVNPVKEGSEKMEVLVQGPQIKAVQDALMKRGVRPAWIEVKEKGTKNGKKKR